MGKLTEGEKRQLIDLIGKDQPLPAQYKTRLFAKDDAEYVERTAVYRLEYKGKAGEQDGKKHFDELNEHLRRKKAPWHYHFYFLSPENIPEFFEAVRGGRYSGWMSDLMSALGK